MDLSLRVGKGRLILGAADGAPLRFEHPDLPGHGFLLDEATERWHTAENRWGTGFLVSDLGTCRWNRPRRVEADTDQVTVVHDLLPGLELEVTRTGGEVLVESYRLVNALDRDVQVTGLGIQTPLRDIYPSAEESLAGACHAHVWTGGSWSWVLAQPMSGQTPLLGLILREGALWSYSIESRNHASGSNVRGHVVLQATDLARNPAAFGGQPTVTVPAHGTFELTWELAWYDSVPAFLDSSAPPVRLPRLHAELGQPLLTEGAVSSSDADVVGDSVYGRRHGIAYLEIGAHARTAVLFHLPRRELVERRIRYILDHQRPVERGEPFRHAFVPVDSATRIRQLTSGWADWSDGAERLAMPLLLQQARRRGWGPLDEIDSALEGFATFARSCLIATDGSVTWGSDTTVDKPRLYNIPWLAQFFADQHVLYDRSEDLDQAALLLERSYALDAVQHLSIGQPEAVVQVAALLEAAGDPDRASSLRASLLENAAHFAMLGPDLPSHEVNYEQSMVAPLVSLFAISYDLSGDPTLLTPLTESLRWLRAFGGPQPHARLRHIGIRHWDGYWFGRNRLYGDVFPHHWSVLTAVALTQLPRELRTAETDATAEAIFAANLALFREDGSASCAFVMPSSVDGRPGYRDDPLANDQDWALTLWLRTDGAGAVSAAEA
ncbi:hypothetical protein ACFXJ8_24105 [Nonomuraea sp. NPDC059194]|uniref:hypothetical protein n=1 Tax=Nonomuraea sp. NPDC059194 TaxID=3346764 RepID=UPI0036BF1283